MAHLALEGRSRASLWPNAQHQKRHTVLNNCMVHEWIFPHLQ